MKIIHTENKITKWEITGKYNEGLIKTWEKPAFTLTPHHPSHKSFFNVKTEIQFEDTTGNIFVIDIIVESVTQFDANGKPSVDQLFALFKSQENDIHLTVYDRLETDELLINYAWPKPTDEEIKELLKEVLNVAQSHN